MTEMDTQAVSMHSPNQTRAIRSDVLEAIQGHREELEGLGVVSLALFGSVARDTSGVDSDVDILVEIRRPMGIFRFLEIKERLESILQRPVDLVTPQALRPRLRSDILSESVVAFGSMPAA
jgi:predicted nucleotidyltransferase